MKKSLLICFSLCVVCSLLAGNAWAKTVIGSVARVDIPSQIIEVSKNGGTKIVKVCVNGATQYNGVSCLADVKEGSPIAIKAEKDKATKNWIAKSVELGKSAK